jgi:cell division transport system permease protein
LTGLGFWLAGPVDTLALLYQSQFSITGLGFGGFVALLLIGGNVGLIGAWLAVGQHLRNIQPR